MAKDYAGYGAPDFLNDSSFLAWMRGEDGAAGFWREWLQKHPDKMKEVEVAREHYRVLTEFEKIYPAPEEKPEVWARVNAALEQADAMPIKHPGRFGKRWLQYAAVITLLLAAGWFGYHHWDHPGYDRVVKANGHIRKIILPDSTRVVLNKYAQISYSSADAREVSLQGEAYFQVRKETGTSGPRPFIVHADAVRVTVLGTSFSVKSNGNAARVLLLNGKVRVSAGDQSVVLKPGDRLEWLDHHFDKQQVNVQLYMAWKDGEFHFDHTSLRELAGLIKDYYGYDLVIKNKAALQSKTISGTITSRDEKVLWKTLALMFHVRVEKQGSKIIITAY